MSKISPATKAFWVGFNGVNVSDYSSDFYWIAYNPTSKILAVHFKSDGSTPSGVTYFCNDIDGVVVARFMAQTRKSYNTGAAHNSWLEAFDLVTDGVSTKNPCPIHVSSDWLNMPGSADIARWTESQTTRPVNFDLLYDWLLIGERKVLINHCEPVIDFTQQGLYSF